MQLCAANSDNRGIFPAGGVQLVSGQPVRSQQQTQLAWKTRASSGWLRILEDAVGMEFSLVPEVESVFVDCDKENGKAFRVISIINARDPDVRAKVYKREQAVMDAFRGIDFSFRVISRMNRNLSDVIDKVGRLAYQKR
jgi:hypothetical protein